MKSEFFECKICGRSFFRLRSYKKNFCPSAFICNGRLDTNEAIEVAVNRELLAEEASRE